MKFRNLLLISTSLFLNPQNSWAMDNDELKDLRGLAHNTKFYDATISSKGGTTRFTQCSIGKEPTVAAHKEKSPSKFLNVIDINDRCEIIGETDIRHEKVIDGKDERKRKENTIKPPHRFQGQMIMTFPNRKRYTGSGTMVGPHQALTAGHNLFSITDGGWATAVAFIPARNEDQQPYGEVKGEILLSPKEWTKEGRKEHDYGIVILDKDIGTKTGWAGLLTSSDDDKLSGTDIYVSGYPGDKGATQLWSVKGKPTLGVDTISYKIATAPGQSGSGVFMKDKEGYYVLDKKGYYILGVHAYGSDVENSATRITENIFDTLTDWMRDPYMSPPCQGVAYITEDKKWDDIIKATFQIGGELKKVLTLEERELLQDNRRTQKKLLTTKMEELKANPNYDPPKKVAGKRRTQVDSMSVKGIIVSNEINEAGNLRLITRQIVDAKTILNAINIFLTAALGNNPQMEVKDQMKIRDFKKKYRDFNKINRLDRMVSTDPDLNCIQNYFSNPANKTLSLFDSTRYESLTQDSLRKDQIEKSKQKGIPVRHRSTPTANFVRGERVLDIQDELLKEGFELQKKWRKRELKTAI